MSSLSPVFDPPPSRTRYAVLALLALAAMVAYISRNSLAVAESTIRGELGLSEAAMGMVMSAFFLTYAFGQVPTGWIADRCGARRTLPLCAVGWSLATILGSLAFALPALLVSRAANGVAQAGLFPGSTISIARWFPVTGRAFPNGVLASCMSVGGAIAALLTGALLAADWSWRTIFGLYGLMGLAWAAAFWWWFRDLPEQHSAVNRAELDLIRRSLAGEQPAEPASAATAAPAHPPAAPPTGEPTTGEPTPWLALVSSPATWWICAQQFFRAGGFIFFASWFPTYLIATRGVSLTESALMTTLPQLSVAGGSIFGGMLSDGVLRRTGSRNLARRGVAIVSLLACAALVLSAYLVAKPWPAVMLISLGTLCFALGGPSAYTITIDMGDRHVATLFSMMNMCGNIGAMTLPLVAPLVAYAAGWESVLLLYGGSFGMAAVCWWALDPRGTVFDQALARAA